MRRIKRLLSLTLTGILLLNGTAITVNADNKASDTQESTNSILSRAVAHYDFEDGTEKLDLEGEEKLLLVDSGEKNTLGNAVMLPVVSDTGNEYVKEQSDALPEVVEDTERGKVLRFKDSETVDDYVKQKNDTLDEVYKVGEYLQTKEKVGGRVHLDNPYKGKELDGVTIAYWVKAPTVLNAEDPATNNKGGKYVGANSTTVVFNNDSRYVVQREDLMKQLACKAYDTFQENPALASIELIEGVPETKVIRDDFSMGTQKLVTDDSGKTYILYEDYGKLIRCNPNYPLEEIEEGGIKVKPAVAGGWYYPYREPDRKISVTDGEGRKCVIASLATGTNIDTGLYEKFRNKYPTPEDGKSGITEEELNALGYSSQSEVRDGYIKGSLQITTDNDFGFREDSYRTESQIVYEDGVETVKRIPVSGAKVCNPNCVDNGEFLDFYGANQFYFDGDEFVTQGKEEDVIYDEEEDDDIIRPAIEGADTWHYVTIVIENDWVQTYVDGVAADVDAGEYQYLKDVKEISRHEFGGGNINNGKLFCCGYGLRGIYGMYSNIADWSSDGTAVSSPSYAAAITMLDWLADENTELYLGGTGLCSEMLTQGYGTVDGVCMDDVTFFDMALSKKEAVELYNEVKPSEENPEEVTDKECEENFALAGSWNADGTVTVEMKVLEEQDTQMFGFDMNYDGEKNVLVSAGFNSGFKAFYGRSNLLYNDADTGVVRFVGVYGDECNYSGAIAQIVLRPKGTEAGTVRLTIDTMMGTTASNDQPYEVILNLDNLPKPEPDNPQDPEDEDNKKNDSMLDGVWNADGTITVEMKTPEERDTQLFGFDISYDSEKNELVSAEFSKELQALYGTRGSLLYNDALSGKVRFVGVHPDERLYSGVIARIVLRPKSTDAGSVLLSIDNMIGITASEENPFEITLDLDSLKKMIINPDGSVTERETETTVATDGAVTEKVTEVTTATDGAVTEKTTETTTHADGTLEQQIETLKRQLDALIKIVETLKKFAEEVYNRVVVTEKISTEDGSMLVKTVHEISGKDETGAVVKKADVVDEKKDASGTSVERYEYNADILPENVEWKTSVVDEFSVEDKAELDKRGAGSNMELYDITPQSQGMKVEPENGSVRVSLHKGDRKWDEKKVKVFDFEKNCWLDTHFEGDFIIFEAEHFSSYAIVQLDHVKKGDADLSGDVTLSDAQTALRAALNIKPLSGPDETAADIDGDERVSLADAEKILKAALHVEELQ